ncbi:phosphohydrolase [Candidatus Beckwithbacteria bacterium CG10_big_fil_rev_8_21_14_0_10_34_10]|uniref:Phosphohydrolase n=1 Tax=Candidatus Beckwithbacteria bacterium CG10_big_fil_rev_8_21_14_0_10_34_10 TaxID=1974495 RepID=A0A2H0WBG1_9BACT|nr:MAG: phosphohydrolase [Candidatus Beckwithbacteria bacterium CG10_big_fil_rev_8_21_14_0_10_34_10]
MISKDEALKLLRKYLKTENTVKHSLALEAIMRALAKRLAPGKEDEWAMAGLLHDLDYETVDQKTFKDHGLKTVEILKKEGVELTDSVLKAILAHNFDNLGDEYKPQSLMDWSIFIADSLTGLIVAATLVRPDRKLETIEVKSLKKKFKDKAFARGTRREEIKLCQEKLGLSLDDFLKLSLSAMREISDELGL